MDNEKVNEALRACKLAICKNRDWDPETVDHVSIRNQEASTPGEKLEHLLWMIKEASYWDATRLEKKFRWLGFVQGALWDMGIQTIEEAKRQNMPAGEEFQP